MLDRAQQVENQEAATPRVTDRRERQAKAANQRIGESDDRIPVRFPPCGVTLEQRGGTRITAFRSGDELGKHRDVAEREIEALSGDRMQGLRGVAENRGPRRRQALRTRERKWIALAAADTREAPEPQAKDFLEFCKEGAIVEGQHPARRFRRERPDDGGAPFHDRQHCERTVRREAFIGGVVMEPRGIDVGDDRVLAVIGDARFDAEGGANRGLRAVRRDHQAGLDGFRRHPS